MLHISIALDQLYRPSLFLSHFDADSLASSRCLACFSSVSCNFIFSISCDSFSTSFSKSITLFCKCFSPSSIYVSFGRIQPPAWLLLETNSFGPSEGDTKLPTPVVFVVTEASFGIINGDDLTPPDGEEMVLVSGSTDFGAAGSFFSGV